MYEAERAAFDGTTLDEPAPLANLVELARAVTSGTWWAAAGGPAVLVAAARRGTRASRATSPAAETVEVRLADGQTDLATLAHELAHALAGVRGGHGARFRAAHVDVVAVIGGAAQGAALVAAYDGFGVPAGVRGWPAPWRITGPGFAVVP